MALTDVQAVRLKTGDKSALKREVYPANGEDTIYRLEKAPVLSAPAPSVWVNGAAKVENTDYTVDYDYGVITFTAAPTVNHSIEIHYYWSVFTDEEVQHFLDDSSGDILLGSAKLLLAIAADRAKVAIRETLQGGGGMGGITRDTSVAARELRETAKALLEQKLAVLELEGVDPADQFTEVLWTEFHLGEADLQAMIRDGIL